MQRRAGSGLVRPLGGRHAPLLVSAPALSTADARGTVRFPPPLDVSKGETEEGLAVLEARLQGGVERRRLRAAALTLHMCCTGGALVLVALCSASIVR